MKAIGGYPALELQRRGEYHTGALRLNSARNAFGLALAARKIRKVFLPLFTCSAMLEPLERLGIECVRYAVTRDLEPAYLPELREDEAFVYTNYFDLKREAARHIAATMRRGLIIDNAQAFYCRLPDTDDVIYSPRKFFGVSDGAYLYTTSDAQEPSVQDSSSERILPQLKRIEGGAEAGYGDFRNSEESIDGCPPARMSNLTKALLESVDYEAVRETRRRNFHYLSDALDSVNELADLIPAPDADFTPMVYPFMLKDSGLRKHLISQKIFVATYWPNVLEEAPQGSIEHDMARYMLPLPIDQTLGTEDMQRIVDTIKSYK